MFPFDQVRNLRYLEGLGLYYSRVQQLKIQRDLGKCFTEFSEGRIAFIP